MSPFFSIIVPVYNCEQTLSGTFESVLKQSFDDYEIIIINDYSTDNSLLVINKFKDIFGDKIKIINNEKNIGVASSRNKGFAVANGKYVALLDSDDIWDKSKLSIQKKYIDGTNCDICCTSYSFINSVGETIKKPYIIPNKIDYKTLLKENVIGCSTVAVRRDLLNANSMRKEYYHEDYALWLDLTRNGANIVGITDVLMHYRILENSRSYNKISAASNRFKIYIEQEKIGVLKAMYYFICYTINGFRKKFL